MSTLPPAKGRIFCSRIVCLILMCFVWAASTFATLTVKNAQQYRADTGAVIPPSGTIPSGAGLFLDCAPTDTTGAKVQMQVELQKLPAAWTGNPSHVSSFVASGSRPRISVAAGLAVGNYGWRYRVVNSAGLTGVWVPANSPDFIVQAVFAPVRATSPTIPVKPQPTYTPEPAADPSISRVSPASLPPMNGNQPLTIRGNNFQNGATLSFVPPEGGTIRSSVAKLTFVSANQINYQINNENAVGTWTVQVNNPDGQSSRSVRFNVAAIAQPTPSPAISTTIPVTTKPTYPPTQPTYTPTPVVTPSISRVSPASLPPMNGNQPLTISGNNFQDGATLSFVPPGGGTIKSYAAKLNFVSANQINYQINNENAVGTWTVQVINPDGQSSSPPVSFTVKAIEQPTPSIVTSTPIPVRTKPTYTPTQPTYTPAPAVPPSVSLQNPPVLALPNNAPLIANNTQSGINTPGVLVKGPRLGDTSPAAYCEPSNPFIKELGGQCTAFCWGRANEKLGITNLPITNAQDWIQAAQGAFQTGSEPQPNSIAVWSYYVDKDDGTRKHVGHVAFIEDVIGDKVIFNEANFLTALYGLSLESLPGCERWGGGYDGSDGIKAGPKTMKIGDMNPRRLKKTSDKTMELLGYIYLERNTIQASAEGKAAPNRVPIIQDIVPTAPSTYSKQPQVSKPPSSINPQFPAGPSMNSRSSKPERRPMMPGVSLVPDQAP
jgi:surface antigen